MSSKDQLLITSILCTFVLQVEALLYVLILLCLFLTVLNIGMFRIICYIRGAPIKSSISGSSEVSHTGQTSEASRRQGVNINGLYEVKMDTFAENESAKETGARNIGDGDQI